MMKKSIFIAFLSLFFVSLSCGAKEIGVEAKIKNLKDREIVVNVYDIARQKKLFDSVIYCKKGKFSFEKQFLEPVYITFVPKSGFIDTKKIRGIVARETMVIGIYLVEGESPVVHGVLDGNMLHYNVSGSEINAVLADQRNRYLDGEKYADMESEYFRDNRTPEERDSVYRLGEEFRKNRRIEQFEFLKHHLDSQLSALFLSDVTTQMFDDYYDKMDESVQNGIFKSLIESKKRYSDLRKNGKLMSVGADAIDFTLKGLEGDSVRLSDLKGSYVMLYFWGSW